MKLSITFTAILIASVAGSVVNLRAQEKPSPVAEDRSARPIIRVPQLCHWKKRGLSLKRPKQWSRLRMAAPPSLWSTLTAN